MNFKTKVEKAAGYVQKGLEWYGTAKTIYHTGKFLASAVAPLLL